MIGPIVVPNEFTPPVRLILLLPVFGSPNKTANGLAAVCCNEKPSATINNPTSILTYIFDNTANIIATAPSAEKSNPYTMLRLYPPPPTNSLCVNELYANKPSAPL